MEIKRTLLFGCARPKICSGLSFELASVVGCWDWGRFRDYVLHPGRIGSDETTEELLGGNQEVDVNERGIYVVQAARWLAHLGRRWA